MRVLLTGAGGFVGKVTGERAYDANIDIIGTVHTNQANLPFSSVACELTNKWNFAGNFDTIVHTAGTLPYKNCSFDEYYRNNVVVMQRLLEFAKRKGVRRVIYLSSIAIYGEFREEIIAENADIINPDSYGITKYVAECLLRDEQHIESVSLRLPGIIGVGGRGVWFINTVEKFRRNEPVTIYTPNFPTKNFVWVYDLADYIVRLLEMPSWEYDVINVGCAKANTTAEIVAEMKKETGSGSKIIVDNSIRKPFCLNTDRAIKTGYVSLSPLEIVHKFCELTR